MRVLLLFLFLCLIPYFYLDTLPRILIIVLNRSGNNKYSSLFASLRGEHPLFYHWVWLCCRLFCKYPYWLIPNWLIVFFFLLTIHRYWILSNAFSASINIIILIFTLFSINMIVIWLLSYLCVPGRGGGGNYCVELYKEDFIRFKSSFASNTLNDHLSTTLSASHRFFICSIFLSFRKSISSFPFKFLLWSLII